MKKTNLFRSFACAASAASLGLAVSAATLVSDLEDTGLAPDEFWDGDDGSGGFYSRDVFYHNHYNVDWFSWSGFALSRVNDPDTFAWSNQFAVWGDGTDVSGSGTYAVAYDGGAYGIAPSVTLPCPSLVRGFYIHNTAYTALSIRDGDGFSGPFTPGADDWFRVVVSGRDAAGAETGSVTVYLADYRTREFLLDQWRWVDLTPLGPDVRSLSFRVESSDVMKPTYFALDGLELVPQPVATVVDFDRAPPFEDGVDYWNGSDGSGGFLDSAVHFGNAFTDWGGGITSWAGFALSRVENTTTPGPGNQYAVWGDGKDASGDGRYAIAYDDSWNPEADKIAFPYDVRPQGFFVNNTTYAALAMRDGDAFAKKFGGASGDDPDWFKLTVTGRSASGAEVGSQQFYLADYRFEDNAQNYIVDEWTWVDLSGFEPRVRTLHFALSSSDTDGDYVNTPTYFAMDDLTYRYAPGGSHDADGSLLDQGVPGFVEANGVEVVNPRFVGWATTVVDYSPAPEVEEEWSDPSRALGEVTGDHTDIVSLGDLSAEQIANGDAPGSITLGFDTPIRDGEGPDFAVFENGFVSLADGGFMAELAYVEVSSDGVHFARFPSRSDTPAAVGPYGTILPRNVHNLAGKSANYIDNYGVRYSFGTPFDLADLAGDPLVRDGFVDLGRITQVRLVDIPGDGSFLDSYGQPIYDAWPTILSGGFDLEALGVLNAVLPGQTGRGVALSWIADQRLVGDPLAAQERDLDNDGQKAWQEYYAGTDPNDPASRLQLSEVRVENGTVRVAWQGSQRGSDIDFTLQRRARLTEGDWTDHEVDVPRAAGGTQTWEGAAGDGGFFRVLVKMPEPEVN